MRKKQELVHKYHRKTPGKHSIFRRKKKWFVFGLVLVLFCVWWTIKKDNNVESVTVIESQQNSNTEENDQGNVYEGQNDDNIKKQQAHTCTVSEGDIPADIFSEHGNFDMNDTLAILEASEDVFDLTHLKIGQNLRFYFDEGKESKATRMEYDCNTEKKIVVERNGQDFKVQEVPIEYEVTQEIARGTIDDFFYVDAMQSGLSEATAVEVADLFAFDIDFMTNIRKGDSFVVVYEKRKRDGQDAPDGKILAAKFVNDGQTYYAYYFDNDNDGAYYDGDGHELEKQFLKAPLSYKRISSTFTNARFHPITKKWTAHQQVDYAAPTGTPVVAAANGTITSAGWEGGWGNMIRMKHDNGYTTHYGHLSGFAKGIKTGVQVSRGDLIGFVGSTGWSTGPHLDYGMKQNGTPINPLSFVQPKGEPLEGEMMQKFEEVKKRFIDILQ
jgi:murein DD-endopeptidase MepM/ murein hydrolase activator NlpD